MLGLKTLRKGCIGCFSVVAISLVALLGIRVFAPWIIDSALDWVLYVPAPQVAVSQDGGADVKRFMRDIYVRVLGDTPDNGPGHIELKEGDANAFLGGASDDSAIRDMRVDFTDDGATVYAAIDLARLSENPDYRDLTREIPSFVRGRRVSLRLELRTLTTVDERLSFRDADVKIGRVWLPVSASWAMPLIQRVAEKKLGTQLPDSGLPIPPGTTARMTDDALVVDFRDSR
jgi:hypothetical protein